MLEKEIYNAANKPNLAKVNEVVDFLYEHLDDYGDPKQHIRGAVEYAIKESVSFGGFVLLLRDQGNIKGAVVINHTGMHGYIPENILVYIAIHKNHRGEGLGRMLMEKSITMAKGDIALHVEPDNPAFHLYKKLGFHSKYLELRLVR